MNINQLNYFNECYRQKSFSTASQNLYISIPALSHSIKSLEKELNVSLFVRSNMGLIPTPEGDRFYLTAQKVLLEINNFQLSILSKTKKKIDIIIEKNLSISFSDTLYNNLKRNHPDFRFNIQSNANFKLFENFNVENFHDIDIIICHTTVDSAIKMKENLSLPKQYECIQLKKGKMKVLMNKRHPLCKKRSIILSDCLQFPLIYMTKSYCEEGIREFLNQQMPDCCYNEDIYTAESEKILLDFIQHENAVYFFERFLEVPDLEENELLYRYVDGISTYYYYVIYNSDTASNFYQTIAESFYS